MAYKIKQKKNFEKEYNDNGELNLLAGHFKVKPLKSHKGYEKGETYFTYRVYDSNGYQYKGEYVIKKSNIPDYYKFQRVK